MTQFRNGAKGVWLRADGVKEYATGRQGKRSHLLLQRLLDSPA